MKKRHKAAKKGIQLITKLHGQRFKGYGEYLTEDNALVFHDVDSGEDVGSELREVPAGSIVLTPRQQAAHKAYKERRQKIAAQKKELGQHIYVNSCENAFRDLPAGTVARAAYLGSYICFGTDELWQTRVKRISRKDLPSVMNLSKPTADRFWRDVKGKYFLTDNDGFLHTVGQSFIKGKLNVPSVDEYQKLYIASPREIYEKIPVQQHKRLGYALKMLPFLNFEYNILCYNPTERMRDEIVPITVAEFCEKVGFDRSRAYKLPKEYSKLTFTVKGRKEVFCKFFFNGDDILTANIYINPRLIYKGSDFRKVAAIGISFAADSTPVER